MQLTLLQKGNQTQVLEMLNLLLIHQLPKHKKHLTPQMTHKATQMKQKVIEMKLMLQKVLLKIQLEFQYLWVLNVKMMECQSWNIAPQEINYPPQKVYKTEDYYQNGASHAFFLGEDILNSSGIPAISFQPTGNLILDI